MSRKPKILRCLLDKNLTTRGVADCCGYSNRPNKYGLVDTPLKELEEDGLIYSKRMGVGKGRPASFYYIKKDLETVRRIYKDFPELREDLRQKDWVLDLIIEELDLEDAELREEVREMLKLSPSFFELSFKHPVKKIAYLWFSYMKMSSSSLDKQEEFFEKHGVSFPYAFHELFAFCVFTDYLKEGKRTKESFEYLGTIRRELQHRDYEFQAYWTSAEIMDALKTTLDLVKANNWNAIQWLMQRVDQYYQKRETQWELSKEDEKRCSELEREQDEIYDSIANFLRLMTFRRFSPFEALLKLTKGEYGQQ